VQSLHLTTKSTKRISGAAVLAVFLTSAFFGFVLLSFFDKGDFVIAFNKMHNSILDHLVKNFTHLGDGLVFLPIIFLMFLRSYGSAVSLIATGVTLSVIVNLLKQVVYTNNLRPMRFFEGVYDLHFIDGVQMHGLNSFPSGHTATAAAIAVWLALEFKSRLLTLVLVTFAVLIGLSRVYLAQHFMIDVVFGFLAGTAIGWGVHCIMHTLLAGKHWAKQRFSINLFRRITRL
jgi:membrane-associated phospholipid phosphatase